MTLPFSTESTMNTILPLLPALVADSESIIRQHLVSQLLPLCLTCMFGDDPNFDPNNNTNEKNRSYNLGGYAIATVKLVSHMNTLIKDPDMDVRKAASDALATLALYIRTEDIPSIILKIPLQLVHHDEKKRKNPKQPNNQSNPNDNASDDLCITASHLFADVASISSEQVPPEMVSQHISPTVTSLCKHPNFRVRRAAVQALPRVIFGSSIDDVQSNLIPSFIKLSQDEIFRVRKGVGECLVDMSRSLMMLPNDRYVEKGDSQGSSDFDNMTKEELKTVMRDMRRKCLVPICTRLLQDSNKVVRHGMMQFLGPFIASFYPLDGGENQINDDGIVGSLSRKNQKAAGGMGVQFFPHANGMVTRLNPESICSPASMPGIMKAPLAEDLPLDSKEYLESLLPEFLEKCDNDAKSLVDILRHRTKYPIDKEDIAIVDISLLPSYAELASMNTGDDNVDAEMRVYCAYSLPAVVLLLGKDGWDKSLKQCFLKLITGSTNSLSENHQASASFVPLPVKRCLASSFHTLCNMLGPTAMQSTAEEEQNKQDLLTIFEVHFLRDSDDTVRLNIIRNLPSFLSLLSFSKRSKYLPVLCEIIRGDTMLASKRTNALNPSLLNWRQRDMIAQILPSLICLYRPDQVRQYLWPIVKTLLNDSVNLVRQNVEWSIPILLKCYEYNNCLAGRDDAHMASKFSQESCNEIYIFLKATLLENRLTSSKATTCGAFSKRQSYCRILSATALVLRLYDLKNNSKPMRSDEDSDSDNVRRSIPYAVHPFYSLTPEAYKHLHHLLRTLFLPPALAMRDDRVTNVRLALAKCLKVMPSDIRDRGEANTILRTLVDEIETWEGGGGQHMRVQLPKIKPGDDTSLSENDSNAGPSKSKKSSVAGMQMYGKGDKKERYDQNGKTEDDSMSLASI